MKSLLFLSLTFTALAIDTYFSDKYVTQITSKDISSIIKNPEYMTVIFFYDILNYKAIALGEILIPTLPKYKNYLKFFAVSCENDPDFCTPEVKFEMPLVQAFIPKGVSPLTNKLVITEKVLDQISYPSLIDFFESNIPYLGDYIDLNYTEEFLAKENNKLILFSKEDNIMNEFKALSSKHWGNLEFGVVYINQTELLDRFKIYSFPSIVAVKGKDVVHFEGMMEFTMIDEFIEDFKSKGDKKIVLPRRFLKEFIDHDQLVDLPEFPSINANLQGLDNELAKDNELTLVHFFRDVPLAVWTDLEKIYSGAVKMINFQVNSELDELFAKDQNVKRVPSVRLFPSNRKRKSVELSFSSQEELDEEIGKELKPDIKILQDSTLSLFIDSLKFQYKVGFLLISQGKIPVQIKGIAKKDSFKHFASFGYYNKAHEEALKLFTINKFPCFIALIKKGPAGGLRVLEYKGRLNDFRSLYYFVDELALPTLMPESIPMALEEDSDPVVVVKSSSQFSKTCLSKSGQCALTLFDGKVTQT